MSTLYYVHETTGVYIGGIDDDIAAPANSVTVPTGPNHVLDVWSFDTQAWVYYKTPQPQMLTALIATAYAQGDSDVPWELFAFLDAIRFGAANPTLRTAFWARLKADAPPWATTALKDKMVAWAIAAGCPLE